MCGCRQPEPMTSQALSAAAASNGVPAVMLVPSAASAVIVPITLLGGTSYGRDPGLIASACHFQSFAAAHFNRL
jgi:hypothetical protein